MTRFFALLSCLILMLGLCIGVSAADNTRAYTVNVLATVSNDGSCEVTSTITLHVDTPQETLVYPVPLSASNITLNGSPTLTEKNEQARLVDLSKMLGGMSGDFSFTITYSIHSAVSTVTSTEENTANRLQLELPLLAGFAYPIDQLQFSINLPGNITQKPNFISGYHQANIEKDLSYSTSGNNIAGRNHNPLKDHETLTMFLVANNEMFPQTRADLPDVESITTLIVIVSLLALVFWILVLRNFLPFQNFSPVPPQGFGAGQMGTILTMSGADLSLMVFTWAQLGYVTLHLDRRDRVLIAKQMDMGNERTHFEQKCFYQLFSRRDVIDTSSMGYQRILQTVAMQRPAKQLFLSKGRGGVKFFRVLMAIAGMLSGACFGIILGNMLDYGWLFMLVLSLVGLICSWHIQAWPYGYFLHLRSRLFVAAVMCVLWLVLGIVLHQFGLAFAAVLLQTLAGLMAAFGGRRTEEGKTDMGQVLSLRRYLRKLTPKQAQSLCRENPEAFFDLAPYAIALGCDKSFARKFGKSRMPVCPYIQANNTRGLTAQQWSPLMRHMLDSMTAHQKRMYSDTLRSVLRNYMK